MSSRYDLYCIWYMVLLALRHRSQLSLTSPFKLQVFQFKTLHPDQVVRCLRPL